MFECLSEEIQKLEPGIPWAQIVAMRNILLHHYFGIDRDAVWSVATKRDAQGWSAEIRIPFKTLRFERSTGGVWGANFSRPGPGKIWPSWPR